MGYYPTGQDEIDEEVKQLKRDLYHQYRCKKCRETHSKAKCPYCGSTSKQENDEWK